ncbi:hypothetical protein LCGC14_2602270 [marine sediment metagenome]|uniref:Uncharacterized protein n=1 Tax=marine sediment metagenome TaxID=412755 RepID=A0A0F9A8M8_9ZZZZ
MDMKERTIEQEAEHRQLEAEALVEAQRDRDMFESDESLGRDEQAEGKRTRAGRKT